MGAVVTYQTNTHTPRQPAIQVSTLPSKMTTGQDLLKKVVEEFISCWRVQRDGSLSFTIEDGKVTLAFSTTLGAMNMRTSSFWTSSSWTPSS